MMAMNVPKYLWSKVVMTVAYLMNRMPSRVLSNKTPIECLTGKTNYVVTPKVFGCVCFVKDYRPSVGKLDPRAVKCIFVGYSGKQKGFWMGMLSDAVSTILPGEENSRGPVFDRLKQPVHDRLGQHQSDQGQNPGPVRPVSAETGPVSSCAPRVPCQREEG